MKKITHFRRLLLATILCALVPAGANAQVTIGSGAVPRATLDVVTLPGGDTTADGIIAPNLTLAELKAADGKYLLPQTGAIVYVTDASGTTTLKTAKVTAAGYYYFDGTVWQSFKGEALEAWLLDGNNNGALKTIGTNDNFDLPFETNGAEKMRLTTSGLLGIGTANPKRPLHVNQSLLQPGGVLITNRDNIDGADVLGNWNSGYALHVVGINNESADNIYLTSFNPKTTESAGHTTPSFMFQKFRGTPKDRNEAVTEEEVRATLPNAGEYLGAIQWSAGQTSGLLSPERHEGISIISSQYLGGEGIDQQSNLMFKTSSKLRMMIAADGKVVIGQNTAASVNGGTNNAQLTVAGDDACINGITVGLGGGAVGSNTVVGAKALAANTSAGTGNTALGTNALAANTTGDGNVAVGHGTLVANTSGSWNTAIGVDALTGQAGQNNVAVGAGTLARTTGSNNIGIGNQAGDAILTGKSNIVIGHHTQVPDPDGTGQLAIGGVLYGTGLSTGDYISSIGLIGIGTDAPTEKLDVNGKVRVRDLTANASVPAGSQMVIADADGVLSKAPATGTGLTIEQVCNLIYPVGSIYMSVNSVNPETLFGGTWVRWGNGRAIVGVDPENDITELRDAEGIFGNKDAVLPAHNHIFTGNQLANHNHAATGLSTGNAGAHSHKPAGQALFLTTDYNVVAGAVRVVLASDPNGVRYIYSTAPSDAGGIGQSLTDEAAAHSHTVSGNTANASAGTPSGTISAEGVSPTNANMQPSIAVYLWKRIE